MKNSRFKITFNPELAQAEKIELGDLNVLEQCMAENLKEDKITRTIVDRKPWRQRDTSTLTETVVHSYNEKIQERLNNILTNSYKPVPSVEASIRENTDTDITAWTNVTVKMSNDFKVGPKMSFPVLVQSNKSGDENIQMRTKRWGTGQMAFIGALSDDDPIQGPPTYVEVFKKASHMTARPHLNGTNSRTPAATTATSSVSTHSASKS